MIELLQEFNTLYGANLTDLAETVHANAVNKGFHPETQSESDWLAHMCCNKHGEITELYDAWRNGTLREPCDKAPKMEAMGLPGLTCLEEEMADLLIRVLDESRRMKIDIARAVATKHLFNRNREYMHGKRS